MRKELYIAIITALVLFGAFVFSVIITEKRNIDYIKSNYTTQTQTVENGTVSIPSPSEKAIQYQKNKVIVWSVRTLLGFIIPALFLFLGWSRGIRNWAMGKNTNFIIILALYFIAYSLIDSLLNLPLDFYSGFIRSHSYGLSNQTFGRWLAEWGKGFLLNTVLGAAFIWVPFTIIKRSPDRWWLYLGLVTIPVLLFMSYISPLYIDPIFNKYGPVRDTVLDTEIHAQLQRTVIGDCNVFEVDKSVDTNEMNAYMTGMFNSKRIVLWDTTIKQLTHRETLGILAHEMGHYLLGHIWKSTILGGLFSIIIFWLVNKTALWVIVKSGGTFGFYRLYDIAALPLLIIVINIFMFVASPGINAYSRQIEADADRFEIELTRDNQAAATAIVKLHEGSLALPRPGLVYTLWNYDHPTYQDRVDFLNTYRPWEENRPLKYQRYIIK